jgi:hypothetical protein
VASLPSACNRHRARDFEGSTRTTLRASDESTRAHRFRAVDREVTHIPRCVAGVADVLANSSNENRIEHTSNTSNT